MLMTTQKYLYLQGTFRMRSDKIIMNKDVEHTEGPIAATKEL